MTFGKKLMANRKSQGLTQKALAESAGLSQQSIALYEKEERAPTWHAVQSLAKALGLNCNDLTDDPKKK